MNKFRISNQYDEFSVYVCLKCMSKFTSCGVVEEGWKFCPICATKWDGEFCIRHKKHVPKDTFDWRKPGYQTSETTGEFTQSDKPRLLIENGIVNNKTLLAKDGFYAVLTTPKLYWHLCSYATVGNFIDGKSSFVAMYNSYIKKSKERNPINGKLYYPNLRLRYLSGTNSKIIKQQLG